MNQFTFHGVDKEKDQLYNFARDWDKAMTALGPHVLDSVVPGLCHQVLATGLNQGSLFYDHLLTNDDKETTGSLDSAMGREERINYALEVASASKFVELSKSSPYSFMDQRHLDRLTRNSMDFASRNKNWSTQTDSLYDSFLNVTNFEDLVQAASSGLNVYHSVTPSTRKVIQEASKLAAFTPTPNSNAEDKKVWDKFVDYARQRGFHPLEVSKQDVQTWLTQRAQDTAARQQPNFSYSVSENGDTMLANH